MPMPMLTPVSVPSTCLYDSELIPENLEAQSELTYGGIVWFWPEMRGQTWWCRLPRSRPRPLPLT